MEHSEEKIRNELEKEGPVDQDEFVEKLTNGGGREEELEILGSLKSLMERDEISYNIDWELRVEH